MSDPLAAAAAPVHISGLSEQPEETLVTDGFHDFQITAAKHVHDLKRGYGATEKTQEGIQLALVAEDEENTEPVFEKLFFPDGSNAESDRKDRLKLKRAYHAAGISLSDDLVPSDLVGKAVHIQARGYMIEGERRVGVNWPKVK